MNDLYDLNKIKKDAEFSDKHSYHKGYEDNKFSEEHFIKNKGDWRYETTLDINNERVKEYMIKHENYEKFKTMCLVNIYRSKIIKRKQFEEFRMFNMINIFKEYSSNYIDIESNILLNTENMRIKLNSFDKSYNMIFENCKTKNKRTHKSQFKKEYEKYLDNGDIEQCSFKIQMYMFVRIIQLEEQSLHSSPSLDSISSGVST